LSLDAIFQQAVTHQQAGRLEEAESLCREVLQRNPRHTDSLHMLGILSYRQRRYAEACELIRKAIEIDGTQPAYYSNLGIAMRAVGEFREAESLFRRAVSLDPSYLPARKNLGIVLCELKRPDEAAEHLQHVRRHAPNDRNVLRVVDKMTTNYVHLGLIATLFPRARVIHCRRDPRDVAVSCFFHNFGQPGLGFCCDLEQLAVVYAQYERLMAHWRETLDLPMHDVVYERLVAEPEARIRALIDFCGLDWDPNCLAFHENPRRVRTASALQVRRPIYTSAVGRWKPFAKPLEPFTDKLAKLGVRLDG
jgi:tetratricopeptide (TPR) repeat protein